MTGAVQPERGQSLVRRTVPVLVAASMGLATFARLLAVHREHFDRLVAVSWGIAEGRPLWIALQSRLLGPFTVIRISELGLGHAEALKLFFALGMIGQAVLLYALFRRLGRDAITSLAWVAVQSFLFLVFLDGDWYYPWDIYDALVFTLLPYLAIVGASTGWFVLLFLVALLNRESALFVGSYLVIASLDSRPGSLLPRVGDRARALLGIAAVLLGAVFVKVVRHALFVAQASGGGDAEHAAFGNHVYWRQNLADLLLARPSAESVIVTLWVVGSVAWVLFAARKLARPYLDLAALYALVMASIVVFGLVHETRMYGMLFPIFLFLTDGFVASRERAGSA